MEKTMEIKIEIQDKNTPQAWKFGKDITGVEQLALWMIVKTMAERQIGVLLAEPKTG
jgi:hypothetical protein